VPAVARDELRRVRAALLAGENAGDLGTNAELAERRITKRVCAIVFQWRRSCPTPGKNRPTWLAYAS